MGRLRGRRIWRIDPTCLRKLVGRGLPAVALEVYDQDMANNDRTVSKRSDGQWANKRDGAKRASSIHRTQSAAEREAKRMMQKPGQGGELKVKDEKGKIRSKDTINKKDALPPKDSEH